MRTTLFSHSILACVSTKCLQYRDNVYEDFFPHLQESPSPLIERLMVNPLFLRLESISQLGVLKFGFASGNVTRAAHSKGVRSMAAIYINALNSHLEEREKITPIQSQAIQVAGLLKDIGHGPFSHTFARILEEPQSSYLQRSVKIVRHIFETEKLVETHNLPKDFVDAVCDMITGISPDVHERKYGDDSPFNRYILFTIVKSPAQVSLDATVFDYSMRDTLATCKHSYFQAIVKCVADIIEGSRVVNGQIEYSVSCAASIALYSQMILMNYRHIYFDPECIGLETLLIDAFVDTSINKNLALSLDNLDEFLKLDDNCVERGILAAQKRFARRDAYELVYFWDFPINRGTTQKWCVDRIKEKLNSYLHDSGILPEDYTVTSFRIKGILKGSTDDQSVLKKVRFYDGSPYVSSKNRPRYCEIKSLLKFNTGACRAARRYYNTNTLFGARTIQVRLYAKTSDPKKIEKLEKVAVSLI